MSIGTRIKQRREELGMTQEQLAKKSNTTKQTIFKYETGKVTNIPLDRIELLAKGLCVSAAWLMGWSESYTPHMLHDEKVAYHANFKNGSHKTQVIIPDQSHIFNIPTYNSVSAGFGALATDEIIGYTPLFLEHIAEAEETICIQVKGDSMFPKIEDGDLIQVRKQTSVDSGSVAVVLLDGEEGLVKKIEYGKDWIELHSFNPMYPIMRFSGADVQRISVVGLVKKVIKNL